MPDTETSQTPEWVNETPRDHSYSLSMYENDDVSVQDIDLTRDEYIALKAFLARRRGVLSEGAESQRASTAAQPSQIAFDRLDVLDGLEDLHSMLRGAWAVAKTADVETVRDLLGIAMGFCESLDKRMRVGNPCS